MAQQGDVLQSLFHPIGDATFSLYTPEQIERVSVVLINSAQARTPLNTYQYNSYLDPRMGTIDPFQKCETCHLSMKECQGHLGHISLVDVVYNPQTFPLVARLFSKKCYYCHHFRYSELLILRITAKFACIRASLTSYFEKCNNLKEDDLRAVIHKAEEYIAMNGEVAPSLILGEMHRDMLHQLFASTTTTCARCGRVNYKILKQNGVKLFRMAEQDGLPAEELQEIAADIDAKAQSRYYFISPKSVCTELCLLQDKHENLFRFVFGADFKAISLFIKNLVVTPNRNRAPQMLAGNYYDSAISSTISKIIELNNELLVNQANQNTLYGLIDLQMLVNQYIDSSRSLHQDVQGLRQKLEKKQGLFRQNIQGKRVNFAARSVISPDINLSTSEVGIPDRFAKVLSFPEPVNSFNLKLMQQMVENGPIYPGANYVENNNGALISLREMSVADRKIQAELLAQYEPGKTQYVHRHVLPGDPVIFNRQPTLHRLSMMVHKVRILPGHSKTLRFHYVNCDSYNADFDGDEMNIHMPQTYPQVAEAHELALNDLNYISIIDGGTRRGLIQDSVLGGIILTKADSFFNKERFYELCWIACSQVCRERARLPAEKYVELLRNIDRVSGSNPFSATTDIKFVGRLTPQNNIFRSNGDGCQYMSRNTERQYFSQPLNIPKKKILVLSEYPEIELPQPAILFPAPVYTGKQVVGVMLGCICENRKVNIQYANTLPAETWGALGSTECLTRVVDSELLTGLVDKQHISAKKNGLAHAVQELCGGIAAGQFLTGYGRLAEYMLQMRGFTCSLEDMVLYSGAEQYRNSIYSQMEQISFSSVNKFLNSATNDVYALKVGLRYELQQSDKTDARFDSEMQRAAQEITTGLAAACPPAALVTRFPRNSLAFMIQTGAKGSSVNMQMITTCLGQQSLEGRRVPTTVAAKTLPCYRPFDHIGFIPGGYVFDRFLTGIRPQSFFFHHQAGREGLIDTAVKTATSGYFQRCIIKSSEGLTVQYDGTVRDADGTLVQCLYGGDGLDPCKTAMLGNFDFLARNSAAYLKTYDSQDSDAKSAPELLEKLAKAFQDIEPDDIIKRPYLYEKQIKKIVKYYSKLWPNQLSGEELIRKAYNVVCRCQKEPLPAVLSPYVYACSVKPSYRTKIDDYCGSSKLISVDGKIVNNFHLTAEYMSRVALGKYQAALVSPGEAVGVIAGQSIGEPSTQLTLNTFHLAGHGAANVTLGIPRLREIVMFANQKIATPLLTAKCPSLQDAEYLASNLKKIYFPELLRYITTKELIVGQYREFSIVFTLYDLSEFPMLTPEQFQRAMCYRLVTELVKAVNKQIAQQQDQKLKEGGEEVLQRVRSGDENADQEYSDKDQQETSAAASDDSESEMSSDASEEQKNEEPPDNEEQEGNFISNSAFEFLIQGSDEVITRNSVKYVKLQHVSFMEGQVLIKFSVGAAYQILLMSMLEAVVAKIVVKETAGISNTFIRSSKGSHFVDIEGNNFKALYELEPKSYSFSSLKSNDIYKILQELGVEAARAAIIDEVRSVFDVYHISADYHHLSIIADFMTQDGAFRPLNRSGISATPHVLLKSSFETSCNFVFDAAVHGRVDHMKTASGAITVGGTVPLGTGCFDLEQML